MAFSAKVGAFNVITTAAGNTQAITGVGFQPLAVIFWYSGRTDSTDTVGRLSHTRGMGFAISSSDQRAVCSASTDASASSATYGAVTNVRCITTFNGAGTIQGAMTFTSMDADGFTLTVGTQFTGGFRVHYLALGG